jgi:hypothetical protein
MDNIIQEAVLINKLCWIIIVWRFSNKMHSRIVQINNEKITKRRREALPKTQAIIMPNTHNKIISSNNNTFRVMKSQDQALLLKNLTKQLLTLLPHKIMEVLITTTTKS